MANRMSHEEISEAEVKIIRWGEKVLTPLLVAGFIGTSSFLLHVGNTVAQLEGEHGKYNATNGEIKTNLNKLNAKIDTQVQKTHEIEVTMQRIDTGQANLKEQMSDVKRQNTEILRLLNRQQ